MPGQEEKDSSMNTNLATADNRDLFRHGDDPDAVSRRKHPIASSDAVNDGRWGRGLRACSQCEPCASMNSIRSLGPYVAIELLLPGGTIIALALWAYRKRSAARARVKATSTTAAPRTSGAALLRTPCTQR